MYIECVYVKLNSFQWDYSVNRELKQLRKTVMDKEYQTFIIMIYISHNTGEQYANLNYCNVFSAIMNFNNFVHRMNSRGNLLQKVVENQLWLNGFIIMYQHKYATNKYILAQRSKPKLNNSHRVKLYFSIYESYFRTMNEKTR